MKQSRQPSGPPQTTAVMQPNRRDSNWTVSTEGYGSMRSNTSASRRCSELSQMSSMSTARQNLQSPAWDPISPGSSRRSSEAGARMSPVMSHHLSKLHKKALAAGTTSSLAQSQSGMSMAGDLMTSYNSVMTESMSGSNVQMEDGQGRRMSDPVRPLDRNFGVGGQLSRHRSFGNLQGGQNQRQPLHQQRIRGQEGGYVDQNNGQYMPQGMYNNGMARQGNHQQQQMYAGSRGYGGQYQAGYNGFNNGGYPQQQQQGANNMAAYQQQQFQPGYNQQQQQHGGYPQQQQQWYPGGQGQGYDQSNWTQQQQFQPGYNQ